ncbi:MAG: methyltransferase domain-containing protein [Candidatus Latescibacteria bacterium]|nr:methyltransferase domain-containing protein [Candidatus Latescibacterota bacterium]
MFQELRKINKKPRAFEFYTSDILWNDEHISKNMLDAHLNGNIDAASRKQVFIDASVEWIFSHFNLNKSSRICDFGCGPGLYTIQFAERGATVTGVDLSERSLQYAKGVAEEKGLNIDYVLQDYLHFSTDRQFDLITMIYRDFSVLSPEQRATILGTFRKLLCETGIVFLDVDSMVRYSKASEKIGYEFHGTGGFWSPEPHYEFNASFKYPQEEVVLDKCMIIEKDREREVFMWNQCFSIETLTAEFEKAGLQIVEYYSDVTGASFKDDSPELAFVARKRP